MNELSSLSKHFEHEGKLACKINTSETVKEVLLEGTNAVP